jgi:hypothetical protein
MDNFDLKKFLKESKALENLNPSIKSINEGEAIENKKMTKEAMKKQIKDMIVAELELDIDNPGKDSAEDLYDPVFEGYPEEEEEDTYDYSNDYYDNEYGDSNDFGDTDEFDGYGGFDIDEAKKKDEEVEDVEDVEDVEVTDTEEEMPAEEAPATGGGLEDIAADMKGTEADLMDNLMKAFQIAKGMGNEKLETQVGNTLKFFVSEYIGGSEG